MTTGVRSAIGVRNARRALSFPFSIFVFPLLLASLAAQQTQLTDGQLKAAAVEMPELVKLFDLKPGMTVADVGAGFGAWTMEFAKIVGPSGRVYATDIGAAQLAALREAAKKHGNVMVVEGAPQSTNLPAACCDAILIRDAYHHLTEPRCHREEPGCRAETGRAAGRHRFPAAGEQRGPVRRAGEPARARRAARRGGARSRRRACARAHDLQRGRLKVSPTRCSWSLFRKP